MSLAAGIRLAVTILTVLPVRAGQVDRRAAAVAMSAAPLVGAALGGAAAAVLYGLDRSGASAPLAGAVALVVLVLGTRALHLDGLADTVDALGSYAEQSRALAIMKSPEVGPFGVVAIVLVLGVDLAALADLSAHGHWWAVVVGVAVGRLGITLACRHGIPAARPDGLGVLVAGTVPAAACLAWAVLLGAASWPTLAHRPWLGPFAVALAMLATVLLVGHARRRLGGITGDVLGACCELATATALVVLALG